MALKPQIGFGEKKERSKRMVLEQLWYQSQQTTPLLSNEHESWSITQQQTVIGTYRGRQETEVFDLRLPVMFAGLWSCIILEKKSVCHVLLCKINIIQ